MLSLVALHWVIDVQKWARTLAALLSSCYESYLDSIDSSKVEVSM